MDEVDSGMPWTLKEKSDESWMSKFHSANTDSVCSRPSRSMQQTYSLRQPKNSEASFSSFLVSDHIGLNSYSNKASLMQWNDVLEVEIGQNIPDACISNGQSFTANDCFTKPDLNLVNVVKKTKSFQGTKAKNECLAADSQDYKSQAKAVCTEIKEDVDNPKIVVIKPAELHLLLKAGLEKHLLIDCRSFLEYNTCHVQQAANICCSKIVKRRLQGGKVHIRDLLMQTCDIDVDEYMNVIVYDQCTENPDRLTEDNFLSVLLKKLSSNFETVALLKGGFLAFNSMYPSLCESKTSSYRCGALTSLSQPCLPVTNVGPTRILPFLYLGSLQDALSPDIVQVNEITYVLNVSTTCIKPPYISDGHFLRIPVNDNYSAKLTPYFEQAFQFLDKVRESNGCCLVHCLAGISRSPTLAIAYIMKTLNMSSDDAYRYVKDKRPTISPNFNFLGQLLEYEKQIKFNNNNNSNSSSRIGSRIDSPEIKSYETKHSKVTNAISQRGLKLTPSCSSGPFFDANDISLGSWKSQSQGSLQIYAIDTDTSVKSEMVDEFGLKVHGQPHKSSVCIQRDMNLDIHSSPLPKLKLNRHRPSVLNLGLDPTTSRKVPDIGMAMSKSLTDIKEASETPSPVITTTQEHTVSTSYSCYRSQSADTLLSPFPCGESTVTNHICQNEGRSSIDLNSAQPPLINALPSNFMVVTTLSKSTNEISSPMESKSYIHSLTSVTPSTSCPSPLLKAGKKRPQRSSLSLLLSPVTPSAQSTTWEASPSHSGVSSSAMTCAPSACRIEYKHCGEQSTLDATCITSSIPLSFPTHFPSIFSSAHTLTTSHAVKLKSFNLTSSLPLNLSAQSPTTGLAKLNFGSSDNSENNVESVHINTEEFDPHSSFSSYFRPNYKSLNESLEKLNSFPSTSLDKLNFTPCLSSSNENVHASSDLPRTSGVKRPLNNEIENLKQSDVTSPLNCSGNSSLLLPTNGVEQKQVVHKREGRAKRTMVRPNSIAFSKYPTFDLGSDCQESPSSTSSSTSQDDSSDMCAKNGKKSKPSEYMSDVGFRLGRYSEREVYRQITAAMMKSQSFEDGRKTRSLDDILSSEDDSSAPNCESSHFDLVLHNFTLTPDKFPSPPLFLEKHVCGNKVAEHYNSNSSLSSSSSHTSFHGSLELIQVS